MHTCYRFSLGDADRTYVGLTSGPLANRISKHRRQLALGDHGNSRLQAAWDAGFTSLVAEELSSHRTKEAGLRAERAHIQSEPNPYNIRTGRAGDLCGHARPAFHKRNRPYVYAEIKMQSGETPRALSERYGITTSMISRIRSGLRRAPEPQTSFANVLTCSQTVVNEPMREAA